MEFSIQYLEGGSSAARVSPEKARTHLRAAFEYLPFARVLLGWDLDPRVVETCAEECARRGSDLYLWQPMLTRHGLFQPDPAWDVVALNDHPIAGFDHKPEFTFICPNHPGVLESVLHHLNEAMTGGFYRGVFLDRIRYPSPAGNLMGQLGCFCDACIETSRQAGLDLLHVREALLRLLGTRDGRQAVTRSMLSTFSVRGSAEQLPSLERLLTFRQQSISVFVKEIADTAIAWGLKVGLDCYSPTLAPMVGQDLPELAGHCDWIKVMTYARAYGPASLPFEILALADWLYASESENESMTFARLAEATGWQLPARREDVQNGGLSASILTEELRRGRVALPHQLLAGIELVEIPGVSCLSEDQIRLDSEAVLAGAPDGVVLCWDLWHMPLDRLGVVNSLYHRSRTF
jgi:hypothetical protein